MRNGFRPSNAQIWLVMVLREVRQELVGMPTVHGRRATFESTARTMLYLHLATHLK
jgi:hypothetical protein